MPADTGFFRGAGGGVFEMPLPLAENMQNQVARGELIRVNADGSQYDEAPPAKPAATDLKNAWVRWAVESSKLAGEPISIDDADAMTKNDLIEKYGK